MVLETLPAIERLMCHLAYELVNVIHNNAGDLAEKGPL